MPLEVSYFTAQTPAEIESSALSATSAFLTSSISEATSGGGQITKVFKTYGLGVAGELIETTIEARIHSSYQGSGNAAIVIEKVDGQNLPTPQEILVQSGVEVTAGTVVSSLLALASLPVGVVAGITVGAGVGISLLYDAYLDTPVSQALDFLANEPGISLLLKNSAGNVIAGGHVEGGQGAVTEAQEIAEIIQGLVQYSASPIPFPAIAVGMTVEMYNILGLSSPQLRGTYKVYNGELIEEIAAAFGKTMDVSQPFLVEDSLSITIPFTAFWTNANASIILPDRYIGTYTNADGVNVPLQQSLIFAKTINDQVLDFIAIDTNGGSLASTNARTIFSLNQIISAANATGNAENNILIGVETNDAISGLGGDDLLIGKGGSDTLTGGLGRDSVWAGGANDNIFATADLFTGLQGDYYNGGSGADTLSYAGLQVYGVRVDLTDDQNTTPIAIENVAAGTAQLIGGPAGSQMDLLYSIENIVGSSYGDTIIGDGNNNTIQGMGGNDTIHSSGGTDALHGGRGDDTFIVAASTTGLVQGAASAIFLNGGLTATTFDEDVLDLSQAAGSVSLYNNTVTFADGKVMTAASVLNYTLGAGNDVLRTSQSSFSTNAEGRRRMIVDMGGAANDNLGFTVVRKAA